MPHRHTRRGFTLMELMFTVAVSAILLTLAVPTYADFTARHRLVAASQALALELQQARFDAVQRGEAMHVSFKPGHDWCYAISAQPGCDCSQPANACTIRRGDAEDFGGVSLGKTATVVFDAKQGRSTGGVAAELSAGPRFSTRVLVHPLGRARVCASGAAMPDLPKCEGQG